MKITPEVIISLKENEIFVFGSNLSGRHGAGAAKLGHISFGAKYGVGEGLTGRCYALPTKDINIKTLSTTEIGKAFVKLIRCCQDNDNLEFLLTKVGCGLANYTTDDIANEFWFGIDSQGGTIPHNLSVPIEFVHYKAEEFWQQA